MTAPSRQTIGCARLRTPQKHFHRLENEFGAVAQMRIPKSYVHRLENEFGAAAQKAILVTFPKLFSSAGKQVWGSRSKGYSGQLAPDSPKFIFGWKTSLGQPLRWLFW